MSKKTDCQETRTIAVTRIYGILNRWHFAVTDVYTNIIFVNKSAAFDINLGNGVNVLIKSYKSHCFFYVSILNVWCLSWNREENNILL